jgi:hypothetical protein
MNTQLNEKMWQSALAKWDARARGQPAWEEPCAFCRAYIASTDEIGCRSCPLSMGNFKGQDFGDGDCRHPKHPWATWLNNPNKQTAKNVYLFILARYEAWKAAR